MDAAFHIRPFAFDRVFPAVETPSDSDDPVTLRLRIATLEAECALAAAERDAATAQAHDAGFAQGLAAARADREAGLLAATDALHGAIEEIDAQLEGLADEAAQAAASIAATAAELLAATVPPALAIDDAIGRVLRQVVRGQEIEVAVHPELVDEMTRRVAVRQADDRRRLAISIVADPTLPIGDSHIHWDQGGVVLDAAQRADAVRAAFVQARTLAQTMPAATQPD